LQTLQLLKLGRRRTTALTIGISAKKVRTPAWSASLALANAEADCGLSDGSEIHHEIIDLRGGDEIDDDASEEAPAVAGAAPAAVSSSTTAPLQSDAAATVDTETLFEGWQLLCEIDVPAVNPMLNRREGRYNFLKDEFDRVFQSVVNKLLSACRLCSI